MKLLKELSEEVQYLKEEKDGAKNYYIEGITLQGNLKNRNGRVYPTHVLENEVSRYIKENVEKKRGFGELGHPAGPGINLHLASHLFESIRKDGDNFIAKAKILDTPNGKIVKTLIDEGVLLGISSRGLGTIKENNGIMEVQSDFRLSTAGDIVADPSAPDAWVQGIMEGAEWVMEMGNWVPKFAETTKTEINTAASSVDKSKLEEQILKSFSKFISRL